MKKVLYAMRHCETLFNVQHKSQGWSDSPITPRGRAQCKVAGELLRERGISFDHFYTSTSERCADTMELVCEAAFGEVKPYTRLKGLRECGFGIFEAKDDFCEPDFGPARSKIMKAAGGESDDDVEVRIGSCIDRIMEDPETQNVLIVSSGGSMRHFYGMHETTARATFTANTNCMTYVYTWEDGLYSCVEIIAPDFSALDFGGLDGSGVPNRWRLASC